MSITIELKNSNVSGRTPTVSDLEWGELAINTADGKLFYKKYVEDNEAGVIDSFDAISLGTISGTLNLETQTTGVLPYTRGGTNANSRQAAINGLVASVTTGTYLRGNGSNAAMSSILASDVPILNQNTTGTSSNITGVLAAANGGTGIVSPGAAGNVLTSNGTGWVSSGVPVNIDNVMTELAGRITSSELATDLASRINLIDGDSTVTGSVNNRLSNYTTTSALESSYYTKQQSDAAVAAATNNLVSAQTLANSLSNYVTQSNLELNYFTKELTNNAIDTATSALVSAQDLIDELANYTNTAALEENYYTITEADQAIASATSTLVSNTTLDNYTNTATLQQNYYTKTDTDSAISQATSTLVSTSDLTTELADYTNTATLQQNYYTKTDTDSAISQATSTLVSTSDLTTELADYTNTATLQQNYYTKTDTDSAISQATSTLVSTSDLTTELADYTNTATLQQNYYTKTDTDSAISQATSTLISTSDLTTELADYTNTATLQQNYYTKTDTDSAISQATSTLVSTSDLTTELADYTNTATLQQNYYTKTDTDSAISQATSTLVSSSDLTTELADYTNTATLQQNYYTKTDTDSAISQATSTLVSTSDLTTELADYTNTATLQQNYYTKTDTNSAISQATSTLVSTSDLTTELADYTNTATLQQNYYTKTDTNSAISQATSTLVSTSTLNDYATTVSLQNLAETVAGPEGTEAQYTIKIDNNGHVAGFGLSSTSVNGTPTSAFVIRADKFAIINPSSEADNLTNNPSADNIPFIVENGITYIKSAFIPTLTANKINTNGLSIYSADGTTLLFNAGSSTPIDSTKVSGLGSLAVKNEVLYEDLESSLGVILTVDSLPTYYSGEAVSLNNVLYRFNPSTSIINVVNFVPSDRDSSDNFGSSVSISRNGSILVAGALNWDLSTGDNKGVVYTFFRSGNSWTQHYLTSESASVADDQFGSACCLDDTGLKLVVASQGYDAGGFSSVGKVATYTRQNTSSNWTLAHTLYNAILPASFDYFGSGLSMDKWGSVLAVGIKGKTSSKGQVQIYTSVAPTGWELSATIESPVNTNNYGFGTSVSLNGNGTVLAVSTSTDYIWFYDKVGSSWVLRNSLVQGTTGSNGSSVCLDNSGNILLVGNPQHTSSVGKYNIYDYITKAQSWRQRFTGPQGATDAASGDAFGSSVSISGDGKNFFVGATGWDLRSGFSSVSNTGRVYHYTVNGEIYTADLYNSSISLGTNGELLGIGNGAGTIVVGAPAGTLVAGVPAETLVTTASNALSGLSTKLNNNARNVLSGAGGFATGDLNWDANGIRNSGKGIGFTANGIVAYNEAGNATFALSGTTGDATFAGNMSASSITAGTLQVGASIQSQGYPNSGWKIDSNGSATFTGIVISRNNILAQGTYGIGVVGASETAVIFQELPGSSSPPYSFGTFIPPVPQWQRPYMSGPYLIDTGVPITAWTSGESPIVALVAPKVPGGIWWVTDNNVPLTNRLWGCEAKVLPWTRWSGASTVWIEFFINTRNMYKATNTPGYQILFTWILYKVT